MLISVSIEDRPSMHESKHTLQYITSVQMFGEFAIILSTYE